MSAVLRSLPNLRNAAKRRCAMSCLLQGLVPLPDESRDLFFQACRDRTATTHGLRCMAAPFDRCTAYFGAPFHTHTLGCGQAIVVRLAGTLEAGPGIPRSMSIYEYTPAPRNWSRSSCSVNTSNRLPASCRRRTENCSDGLGTITRVAISPRAFSPTSAAPRSAFVIRRAGAHARGEFFDLAAYFRCFCSSSESGGNRRTGCLSER